jgi:hypothetical protein
MLTYAECRAHAEETDIGLVRGVTKWVFVPRCRATCDVCGRRPNLPCDHHNCPLYRATSDRTIMPTTHPRIGADPARLGLGGAPAGSEID